MLEIESNVIVTRGLENLKATGSPKLIRSLWFLCSSPLRRCLKLQEVSFGMLGKYKGFLFRLTVLIGQNNPKQDLA